SSGHLGANAVEAFNRLGEESATKAVPAVLLLGDQQEVWRSSARTNEYRTVLQMPVKSRQLRQSILKVLGDPR
ncbi:MAG TPA: serine/threonine protein kinase, partial [Planctomycetaceae bacterium]|nr:serine/threonine protein kinase [Planctomycetaceae bacterium]